MGASRCFRTNAPADRAASPYRHVHRTVRVSDRTRLQKLFISVNTPFTRGFSAKIPVYEGCAAGAILGDFGQLWATLGFSELFLHKYAVYKGIFALKYSLQSPFPVNGFCPILVYEVGKAVKGGEEAVKTFKIRQNPDSK